MKDGGAQWVTSLFGAKNQRRRGSVRRASVNSHFDAAIPGANGLPGLDSVNLQVGRSSIDFEP